MDCTPFAGRPACPQVEASSHGRKDPVDAPSPEAASGVQSVAREIWSWLAVAEIIVKGQVCWWWWSFVKPQKKNISLNKIQIFKI